MGASDSKYIFRHRVNQLITRPVSADDHDFWKLLFITYLSTEEVFALIQPADVRRLRRRQPTNLATLLFKCIEQLCLFTATEMTDFTSAANSIRILSRLLPFVFENGRFDDPAEVDALPGSCHVPLGLDDELEPAEPVASAPLPEGYDFVGRLFWDNTTVGREGRPVKYTSIGGQPLRQPLGELLMQLLLRCSGHPGFTCAPLKGPGLACPEHHLPLDPTRLWVGGVAVGEDKIPAATAALDTHRADVLRCLLACCTQPLYEADPLSPSPFLRCATTPATPAAVTLCTSLLNLIAAYNPRGALPYTSYIGTGRESLLDLALHVLLVLLDYGAFPTVPAPLEGGTVAPAPDDTDGDSDKSHAFWLVCQRLSHEGDLQFLAQGLTTLLCNHLDAASTYLPLSQKVISCHAELLLLLWKLLDVNPEFRHQVCRRADVGRLVTALLWYVFEFQHDQGKFGLLQVATYILLALSGERAFALNLNLPLARRPPMKLPPFTGSHLDLLFLVAHQLLTTGGPWVKSLEECWLTLLCNVSPYTKALCAVTASKLLHLFESMSQPRVMAAGGQAAGVKVALLLEVFGNLLQYQYEGNTELVRVLLCRQKAFHALSHAVEEGAGEGAAAEAKGPHLTAVLRAVEALTPEVEAFHAAHHAATDADVRTFLKNTTLVGLLPLPHPIVIRRLDTRPQTRRWLTSWMWGLICLRATNPPLLDGTTVQLFRPRARSQSNPNATAPLPPAP